MALVVWLRYSYADVPHFLPDWTKSLVSIEMMDFIDILTKVAKMWDSCLMVSYFFFLLGVV